MATKQEPDGRNSLIGEFLLALARAPEPVQESIILFGLRVMKPLEGELIDPYPMLSHMREIVESQDPAQTKKASKAKTGGEGRDH